MGKEFVIGDLHFGDDNIRLFERRPWANVKEMNQSLIFNWIKTVSKEDTVFVLGDFIALNQMTEEDAVEILNQLTGKIILIAGNHDKPYLDFYRKHGITVYEYPIVKNEFWILTHEPMYVTMAAPYAIIFAHVHDNPMYNTVSPRSYCVSAERIWYQPILLSKVFKAVVDKAKNN